MPKRKWMVAGVLAVGMVVAAQNFASAADENHQIITDETGAGPVPGGFASWGELMAVQERLDERAERIVDARDASFTGIEVAADQRKMTVYWKGQPSEAATAAIENARRDGITVDVRPADYSEAELVAEGEKVIKQDGVTAVAPMVNGGGLLVSQLPGALPLRLFSPVPLTMEVADPQEAAATRLDDESPYKGGSRWNGCTTGFGISINGAKKMLSAGHCAANGDIARDGGGQTMGTVSGDNNTYDRLYINTDSQGQIYNGSVRVDGSPRNEYSSPVKGASQSFVGQYICSSGAYSGTRCNIRVVATNETINTGHEIRRLVRAEQHDHLPAVGNGDSGGPTYSVASDNTKVFAKGTNTAIDLDTARLCTGVPTGYNGRQCAWRYWYVDVTKSLDAYGAKIVTG